jgi:hypothetical protein
LASPVLQALLKDLSHLYILEPIKRPWLQVYFDDILIFLNNPDEYLARIKEVMAILAKKIFTSDPRNVHGLKKNRIFWDSQFKDQQSFFWWDQTIHHENLSRHR